MKQRINIELVYKKNKVKNVKGETCYSGHVSLNGQPFQFWDLSYEGMINTFEENAKWYIDEILRKKDG